MGCCGSKPLTASDIVSVRKTETILGKPVEDIKKLYSFGDELGKGNFGTTYLCKENSTGKSYACKSISKRKLSSYEEKEAVKTEIQIMDHVSGHPNIVQVKGVHEDKNFIYIVMELCTDGELYDRVKALVESHSYYSEKDAAGIVAGIVKAVQICHSLDVIHRDVKPENFLFSSKDENAVLKAIDFGCSAYIKEGESQKDLIFK